MKTLKNTVFSYDSLIEDFIEAFLHSNCDGAFTIMELNTNTGDYEYIDHETMDGEDDPIEERFNLDNFDLYLECFVNEQPFEKVEDRYREAILQTMVLFNEENPDRKLSVSDLKMNISQIVVLEEEEDVEF